MKPFIFFFLMVVIKQEVFAQKLINDPNVVARNVNGSFSAIEVSSGIDLYLSSGEEAVAISATDEETREKIITEVKDGVLKIYFGWKEGSVKIRLKNNRMRAYVSYKILEKISASGGCDVMIDGTMSTPVLSLNISGGSDFSGEVDIKNLNVNMSGGSDLNISGRTKTLHIIASGGSDVNGYALQSDICTATASGGSDITITVNQELSAEASGGSDINWKGQAAVKKSNASGAGQVSHRS